MNKTIHLIILAIFFLSIANNLVAQSKQESIRESYQWKAHNIEKIKGSDCVIISYVPIEYNHTSTPRDDKDLGVFYFVTGPSCGEIFTKAFASSPYRGEQINPVEAKSLDWEAFTGINTIISIYKIGDGSTKLYMTSFFSDNKSPDDPRDDEYLGIDYSIDSGDPELIVMPFDLEEIKFLSKSNPELYELIDTNSYYSLREMIINEKLIVDKLRREKKLKDITPEEPKMTKYRLKALLSMH